MKNIYDDICEKIQEAVDIIDTLKKEEDLSEWYKGHKEGLKVAINIIKDIEKGEFYRE